MRKNEFDRLISRRAFLKGAAAGAGALAALGMLGTAAGAEQPAEESADGAAAPGYTVVNTDLLIVGAGNNALSAAAYAVSQGKNITVVDKGPFRHGGVSGMSWDAFSNSLVMPEEYAATVESMLHMNINHAAFEGAVYNDPEPNKFVYMVNHGQSLPDRQPDGKVKPYFSDAMCMGQFFRREMDDLYAKGSVTVVDQTMITDILVSEGQCVGAIGLYLPTGELRVFRAKSTIFCTGGCTWLYGWLSVSAATIGTPDNTADADIAAFRHGAGIGDAEFAQYGLLSIYPEGLGYAFGAGVWANTEDTQIMVDVNGDPVFAHDDPNAGDRIYFCQHLAKIITEEGRGTQNGGVYVNIGDKEICYSNDRNLDLLRKFGVEPRSERMEVSPEMYEHGGNPIIDSKMMTEIPGLFCARGTGTTGEIGGGQVWHNRVYGAYAGLWAVEYMDTAKAPEEIDWAPVLQEYDRLHEMRTRQTEDGLRPHVIRQAIQKACGKSLGIYRSTPIMEEALAEIVRIRKEDIPRMVISSNSPTLNIEWKQAIENYNLLELAEISLRASLLREETRGMYLRAEFPEPDDENWACTLVCYEEDGGMRFEKKSEWA